MSKVNRTIRFEAEILKTAEEKGLDVNEVCRNALNKKLNVHDISRRNVLTALKEGMIDIDEALEKLKFLEG